MPGTAIEVHARIIPTLQVGDTELERHGLIQDGEQGSTQVIRQDLIHKTRCSSLQQSQVPHTTDRGHSRLREKMYQQWMGMRPAWYVAGEAGGKAGACHPGHWPLLTSHIPRHRHSFHYHPAGAGSSVQKGHVLHLRIRLQHFPEDPLAPRVSLPKDAIYLHRAQHAELSPRSLGPHSLDTAGTPESTEVEGNAPAPQQALETEQAQATIIL